MEHWTRESIFRHAFYITMAPSRAPSTALLRSLRTIAVGQPTPFRTFSSSSIAAQELESTSTTPPSPDPPVGIVQHEGETAKSVSVGGPRRRRLAIQQSSAIPFDQLPYQCFQEARKVLIVDREEKLQKIEKQRQRILRLRNTEATEVPGGGRAKDKSLKSMELFLEELKILADINDPNVKRRFEDGKGESMRWMRSGTMF